MEQLLDDYQDLIATIPEIESDISLAAQLQPIASPARPREILLIEDNKGDVRLIREAFSEADSSPHITVAHDGEEALTLIHEIGLLGSAPGRT